MTRRLAEICSRIPRAETFADIGCDHGYCTAYALRNGLCGHAYISDVSAACLGKARALLKEEIASGVCTAVCADGLEGLPELPECVLIAGMGGEEIVRILSARPLPRRFVLQPMKNTPKLRGFLLERGAKICEDVTFFDGKYYDLLTGEGSGGDAYSEDELVFGRDNLRAPSADFLGKLREERGTLRGALERTAAPQAKEALLRRLRHLEEITIAITRTV